MLSKTTRMGRRLVALAAATVAVTGAITFATMSSAEARTCSSHNEVHLNDGSAEAWVHVQRNCSDGLSHVWGVVKDVNCDGRRAQLNVRFWNGDNPVFYRQEWAEAGNGCWTEASFHWSSTNKSPRVYAVVRAVNGGPTQSRGDSGWV